MKKFVFLILSCLLLNSCEQEFGEEVGVPEPESNFQVPNTILKNYIPIDKPKYYQDLAKIDARKSSIISANENTLYRFTKVIYNLIGKKEFREKLYQKALENKNESYNFSFKDFFLNDPKMKDLFLKEDANNMNLFDHYPELFPEIEISIPEKAEKWDYKNKKILVGYSPYDENEPVYCMYNQNKVYLDPKKAPDQPVIILNYKEGVNKNEKINTISPRKNTATGSIIGWYANSLTLTWTGLPNETGYQLYRKVENSPLSLYTTLSANNNFLEENNLQAGTRYTYLVRGQLADGSTTDFGAIFSTRASPRNDNQKLRMGNIRFENDDALKAVEPWHKGKPEIYCKIFSGESNTTPTSMIYSASNDFSPPRASICDSDGAPYDRELVDWSSAKGVLTVFWYEDDLSSGTKEITINGNYEIKFGVQGETPVGNDDVGSIKVSPAFKFDMGDSDDVIGNKAGTNIYHWEAINKEYKNEDFYFRIK